MNESVERELDAVTSPAHPALADQMALFESIFQNAPVGLGVVDRAFRYQMVNAVLASINGIPVSAHIGRTPREIVPQLWPMIEQKYHAVLRGETVANEELSGVAAAGAEGEPGEYRTWIVSYFGVRQDEEVIGIGIVVNDVTELRAYRDALRTRTDLYAMISQTSRAAVECQSADALFADVCRIATTTGHFRCAWVGVPDDGHVRPVASSGEDHGYLEQVTVPLDENDPRSQGPIGIAALAGRASVINDFQSSPVTQPWHDAAALAGFAAAAALPLFERGKVVAVLTLYASSIDFFTPELLATLGEVTPIVSFALDAFAAEQEKRRDDAELRLRDRAIRAVSSGICITDARQPDNPMIFVSPGFEQLTGYMSSEVVGQNCRMFQGPETDQAEVKRLRDAITAGEGCTVQLLNYHKNGTTFWNELTVSAVTDDDGTLTHYVGVQSDITERRQLEQQIRQSQKMEAVGQLASGVAHDFNNLLTVIDVCSDLLARSLQDDADSLELAVEIQKAGERAGTLTRQLLAFSRRQVVAPRIIDVNLLVEDSEKLLRRLIGEHINLSHMLAPALVPVMIDPGQLEQVLVNLAVNARDAMPTGGRLTLTTSNTTLPTPLGPLQEGMYVLLEVSDSGTGIDPTILSSVFDPFFTTKQVGKGTGLGLATVKSIVEQVNGHVTIDSTLGAGTTFRVYLPAYSAISNSDDETAVRVLPDSMPRGTETILLVEDDNAVRALSQRALELCGYTVLSAADGYAALDLARDHPKPIALLVSDVVMPNLGGRMLAEAIIDLRPDCRVMFVSGYTDDEVLLHGVVHSEVTMLQKPYSMSELAQTVRRVIDGGV